MIVRFPAWSCLFGIALLINLNVVVNNPVCADMYPSKTVRIVVPVPPGGGMDLIGRTVAQKLSGAFSQQIIVDNRSGAGGIVATEFVAKSPADGYTLIMVTASHITNPSLHRRLTYDPIKDFVPITQLTSQSYIFIIHPSVPARTVKEFMELAKAKSGRLTYGSAGTGLLGHLGMELLKILGRFEAIHVPYKGGGPAMIDTIAGQVDAFFPTFMAGLPHVKSAKVRALAVTSLRRSSLLPDIPTIAESGFPDFEVNGWYGLLAPGGTAKEIVARLQHEAAKILKSDDIKERMAASGAQPVGNTAKEFSAYMQSEMVKWANVIKQSGARAD